MSKFKLILVALACCYVGVVAAGSISQTEAYQMKKFIPGMMPDGVRQFYFIIPDYDRSTGQPGTDFDGLHKAWLGQAVGSSGYCQNGYEISSMNTDTGMIVFEGLCR